VPIIVGEARFAIEFSRRLLDAGVLSPGFRVFRCLGGTARVRVQVLAAIEEEHMEKALGAFQRAGRDLELI